MGFVMEQLKKLICVFVSFCFLFSYESYASTDILRAKQFKGGKINKVKNLLLPLGDSITVGSGDNDAAAGGEFGWRDHLQDLLGIGKYDFVGAITDPDTDATYDVDHAGVGGEKCSAVLARLSTALSTYFVGYYSEDSAVLLQCGTNDCNQSVSNNTTRNDIRTMISTIHAYDPKIDIYISNVTPTRTNGTPDLNPCIDTLGPILATLVDDTHTGSGVSTVKKSNVYLVDMNAAFKANTNYSLDYMSQPVGVSHPNDTGYRVMADTWYEAIKENGKAGS